jgi:hypothetical protein
MSLPARALRAVTAITARFDKPPGPDCVSQVDDLVNVAPQGEVDEGSGLTHDLLGRPQQPELAQMAKAFDTA